MSSDEFIPDLLREYPVAGRLIRYQREGNQTGQHDQEPYPVFLSRRVHSVTRADDETPRVARLTFGDDANRTYVEMTAPQLERLTNAVLACAERTIDIQHRHWKYYQETADGVDVGKSLTTTLTVAPVQLTNSLGVSLELGDGPSEGAVAQFTHEQTADLQTVLTQLHFVVTHGGRNDQELTEEYVAADGTTKDIYWRLYASN